jgi:hypothetical protein
MAKNRGPRSGILSRKKPAHLKNTRSPLRASPPFLGITKVVFGPGFIWVDWERRSSFYVLPRAYDHFCCYWREPRTSSTLVGAGHRSRTASVRKAAYAFPSPSRSEILAFQPMADSRETSTSFCGMPSGFEVS